MRVGADQVFDSNLFLFRNRNEECQITSHNVFQINGLGIKGHGTALNAGPGKEILQQLIKIFQRIVQRLRRFF